MRTIWSICQGYDVWYKKAIPRLQWGKERWKKSLDCTYPPNWCWKEPPRTCASRTTAWGGAARGSLALLWRLVSAVRGNVSPLSRGLWGMGCGGPWAGARNLGNHGNGPAGDNKHGWNFSVLSQATEEWESSGKFLCVFVFNPAVGEGTGGRGSVPNKRSLPSTPTVTGSQILDSLFYIISVQMPTIHVAEEKQAWIEWEKIYVREGRKKFLELLGRKIKEKNP